MVWEWIATIFAGLGGAGIVLLFRVFFKKIPKWMIPVSAGLGMMVFQVYSEYTWYSHTRSLLPPETVVVAEIAQTAPYKPWSYYRPQILKFVAVDTHKVLPLKEGRVVQVNLYFFERRMSANTWPVLIDCDKALQANIRDTQNDEPVPDNWHQTVHTKKIVQAVCGKIS